MTISKHSKGVIVFHLHGISQKNYIVWKILYNFQTAIYCLLSAVFDSSILKRVRVIHYHCLFVLFYIFAEIFFFIHIWFNKPELKFARPHRDRCTWIFFYFHTKVKKAIRSMNLPYTWVSLCIFTLSFSRTLFRLTFIYDKIYNCLFSTLFLIPMTVNGKKKSRQSARDW